MRQCRSVDQNELRKVKWIDATLLSRGLLMHPRRTFDARTIESEEAIGKVRETGKTGVEQAHRTAERAALHVMVRGRDLNQSLQELRDVGLRDEPELFPRLVRFPEFERVEVFDAAIERRSELRLLRH